MTNEISLAILTFLMTFVIIQFKMSQQKKLQTANFAAATFLKKRGKYERC